MKNRISIVVAILAVSMLASCLRAAVYNTPAPLTGTRTVTGAPGGLQATESDWQDGKLTWSIVNNGNDTYTYSYTIEGLNSPALSHLTLDLSDDAFGANGSLVDPNVVTDPKITDSNGTNNIGSGDLEFGDKDGIIGAIKFDIGTEDALVTFTFTSNRAPVYGDIFVKGGSTDLRNIGFGTHLSDNVIDYIARPNGTLPEPASLGVLGLGAIALLRRSRKVQTLS